jgi:hypothetical protein
MYIMSSSSTGRSEKKAFHRKGDSGEPWGIPAELGFGLDRDEPTFTCDDLPWSQSVKKDKISGPNCRAVSLSRRILSGTRS